MGDRGLRLVFRSDRRVELEEYAAPEPGPGQILVRVARSQVSAGTELNFFREHPPAGPLARAHLGYMTVGRVAAVGAGVTDYAPGDRVLACGRHGNYWLVDPARADSDRPDDGYIARLGDDVADETAGFAILGDVALHGVRRAGLQIDQSVAVCGCGIVGQLTLQFARLAGAYPVVAVDLFDSRLGKARVSGATHVVNAAREEPVAALRALTGGRGVEAVFHCAPAPGVLATALAAAAERGTVVLTASAPGTAEIGLQAELLRHELTIVGVYETGLDRPHAYWPWSRARNRRACLRLLASGELRLDHLITHVAPYTEAQAIFEMLLRGGDDWLGVVFAWD